MATMSDPEILVENVSDSPQPKHVGQVDAWLAYISKTYISDDTLDYIKFSFRTEIAQIKLEDAKSLHCLFILVKELYNGDESEALSRFIFSLDLVGHKKFGKKAVRNLCTEYKVSPPVAYDLKKEPRIVQLYQCLTEVACRLSDYREERLRRYYAEKVFNGINRESPALKSILPLLSFLVENNRITEEDQMELAAGLAIVGADQCVKFIINYRKHNPGLSTDDYYALIPDSKSDAGTGSSKTFSSKSSSIQSNDNSPRSTPTYETAYEDFTTKTTGIVVRGRRANTMPLPGGHLPTISPHEPDLSHISEAEEVRSRTRTNTGENAGETVTNEETPLIDPGPATTGHGGRKVLKVCTLAFGLLAVITLIGVGGSGYGTYHAIAHNYSQEQKELVYGGSIIALDEILPYYLTEVELSEISDSQPHHIDFYLVDTGCERLNTTIEEKEHTYTNVSSLDNITGLYLLPGSEFTYNICAVTDASPDEVDGEIIVDVYILDQLQAVHNNFDPHTNIPNASFPVCFENNACSCSSPIHYEVPHPGYYSIRFVLNNSSFSETMRYNYSYSLQQKRISSYNQTLFPHCSVFDRSSKHCTFHFNSTMPHLPHEMNEERCIVADIHELAGGTLEDEDNDFSHIQVNFVPYPIDWFIMSVAFLSASTAVLIVVVIVLIVLCCKLYKKYM